MENWRTIFILRSSLRRGTRTCGRRPRAFQRWSLSFVCSRRAVERDEYLGIRGPEITHEIILGKGGQKRGRSPVVALRNVQEFIAVPFSAQLPLRVPLGVIVQRGSRERDAKNTPRTTRSFVTFLLFASFSLAASVLLLFSFFFSRERKTFVFHWEITAAKNGGEQFRDNIILRYNATRVTIERNCVAPNAQSLEVCFVSCHFYTNAACK